VKSRAAVVFWKEVIDNLRDRRSVWTALLYSLMGPLLLIPVLGFTSKSFDHGSANLAKVAVSGAERAPGLVEYLRQRNIEVEAAPPDPAQAVKDLVCDLVLVIPPEYPDDFRAGRPAVVRIVTDHSRSTAAGEINRVSDALDTYSQTVGALRLVARGVSPKVVTAIAIELDDVATPESEGAMILSVVPIFLLMSIFVGGMYIAVDVTAGERERGSLEPLMSTPLTATEIVLGKLAAVSFFALVTLAITLAAFALVINVAPFPEVPKLKFRLDALGSLAMLVALVPLLLPVGALQMLLASRSRSVKEAFTASSLCMMIPTATGLFLTFSPFKSTTTAMTIPVFGQNLLLNEVLRGAPFRPLDYVVAAATATAAGVVLAGLAVARCAHARMLSE
jgi:sodium transport system permease protein